MGFVLAPVITFVFTQRKAPTDVNSIAPDRWNGIGTHLVARKRNVSFCESSPHLDALEDPIPSSSAAPAAPWGELAAHFGQEQAICTKPSPPSDSEVEPLTAKFGMACPVTM